MSSDFSTLLSSSSKVLSSTQQPTKSQTTLSLTNNGAISSFQTLGPAVTPAFKRSLRELSAASTHLGNTSNTTSGNSTFATGSEKLSSNFNSANYEASAQRLLAQEGGGFDAGRLGRSARQLELMYTPGKSGNGGMDSTSAASLARTPFGVRSGLLRAGDDGGLPIDGTTGGGDVLGGGSGSSSVNVDEEDLEVYLKNRHERILSSILTSQRQETHQTAEDLIQMRMEKDFKEETESILRDIAGYRVYEPTATDQIQLNLNNTTTSNQINNNTGERTNLFMGQPQYPNLPSYQNQTSNPNSSPSVAAAYGAGSKLSDSARRHASIVATLNANSQQLQSNTHNGTQNRLINEFLNALHDLAYSINSSSNSASNTAYLNSIKLIKTIVQHESLCKSNGATVSKDILAKHRAEGILSYLCHQFRSHIMDRVRTAALSGHTFQSIAKANVSGFSKEVVSFVELEIGSGMNQSAFESALLWPKIYFCLRCGDASAALEILQNTNSNESEQPLLLSLVGSLAAHQSTHGGSCLWEATKRTSKPSIPPGISTKLNKSLSDLYHRARARSSSSSVSPSNSSSMDHYKLSVLALLSLVEMPQSILSIKGIVNTIEDYLFCTLWDAVQIVEPESGLPSTYGAVTTISATGETSKSSSLCKEKISKLGKSVKHWGPEYFQTENDTSGWAYAMPLLAAQQFQSALVHLADVGSQSRNGLIHATHLCLVLDFASIDMEDLCDEEQTNSKEASLQLLTNVLVAYATTFQNVDPEAALEYLVRVPNSMGSGKDVLNIGNEAKKQITRLLLETRSFELLAGTISSDGSRAGTKTIEGNKSSNRGGGALDAHFSASQVSSILAGAAEAAIRNGSMRDAAELLALAGHFGDLLTLMNKELGLRLVITNEQQNQEREFWKNASHHFYHTYLAQGRTYVQEVLEAEDNLSLIATFNLLINLVEFFNRCADQKWEDAWSVIDQLQLIPQSEKDLSFRIESYRSMDDSIKQSFHHIVLAGMESLYHQYTKLKSNAINSGTDTGAVDQRLRELKYRGRLMVTFAGLIQMYDSGNIHSRIAQMEAYMM